MMTVRAFVVSIFQTFRSCLLLGGIFLLSGCLPDIFQSKAEYRLLGLEKNKDLEVTMNKFLSERADAIDTQGKEGDVRQREAYQEKQLQEDLQSKVMSEGYYDAVVSYSGDDRPWRGAYAVKSGVQYKIRKISVTPARYKPFLQMELVGQPLEAVRVLSVQEKLKSAIARDRCYFNLAVDNAVTLDAKTEKADILFRVTAGPQAKMGLAIFEGHDKVKNSYLQKLVDWKEGDCFTQKKIDALRAALFESGLFSGVDIVIPKKPLKDGLVPVTLRVKERAFRSFSAGVSYYTDEGLGLTLGWRHRNLLGAAESLETSLKLSQRNQNIEARLTKPFFLRRDQSVSFNASISHEDTDAYLKTGFDFGAAVRRIFTKNLSGSTGGSLSLSEIKDKTLASTSTFYLLSFPQGLVYDTRDNALDAHKGFLLDGRVEPFVDAAGKSSPFGKMELTGQAYHALGAKMVAALRMKIGSIIGPGTLDIPATKRFYAGGGGSVRGFGYQEIGPQKNGEPEGGRSLIETSGELRYKVTDTVGIVTFLDAGSVGASPTANFSHLSVGGGAGLRYYTDFGPLRFDVGVPLNHKETTSASYQFYISIGQAF
jgi:translocation and assembly module TamA